MAKISWDKTSNMKYTQEQIIELARDVEFSDPIDWDSLPIEKDRIYQMIGSQAIEMYERWTNLADGGDGEAIMLATITKLLVENFVLNLRVNSI